MTLELLQSVALYFSSSSAQVWGTLMVFHVLLMRDLCVSTDQALDREDKDSEANVRWVAQHVNDPQFQPLVDKIEIDREARFHLIFALSDNQLITRQGLNFAALSTDKFQSYFDYLASKIRRIQASDEEPTRAFYVGLWGIALNLLGLVSYVLLGSDLLFLRSLVGALFVINLVLGTLFTRQIRRALTCYY